MVDIRIKKVIEFPHQSALESAKHFNAMQTPDNLAFDATWQHSRNAKLCVTDFLHIDCGQIIVFSILDKFIDDEFLNYKRTSSHQYARCFE